MGLGDRNKITSVEELEKECDGADVRIKIYSVLGSHVRMGDRVDGRTLRAVLKRYEPSGSQLETLY